MTLSQNQIVYRNPFGQAEGTLKTENGSDIFGSISTSGAEGHVRFTVAGYFGGGDPAGLFSLWVQAKKSDTDYVKVPIILSAVSQNGGYFSFTADVRVGAPVDYNEIIGTTISQAITVRPSSGTLLNGPDSMYTFSFPYWFGAEPTDQSITISSVTAEFI